MIRENQPIRANLRIDSRKSGHLRALPFAAKIIYNEIPSILSM